MKFYLPISSPASALLLVVLFISSRAADAADFEPIDDVPQDATAVSLPPDCPKNGKVPNTMFTFEVSSSDATEVSSFPKDLVTLEEDGDELKLRWNEDVAYDSKEGGVKLAFPADQLKDLEVQASSIAQILDGFTSVNRISVGSSATLHATFSGLNNTDLTITVSSSASAAIKSNALVESIDVSSSAELDLDGAVTKLSISSSAKANVKGNVEKGVIGSSSNVKVDGLITGNVEVSSSAKLQVTGEITGSIDVSSSANVEAPSCDNVSVSSSGKCSETTVSGLTITIEEQPFTLDGTFKCFSNSSASRSFGGFSTILFAGLTLATMIVNFL